MTYTMIILLCGVVYVALLVGLFSSMLPSESRAGPITLEPAVATARCDTCEAVAGANYAVLERVETLLEEILRERGISSRQSSGAQYSDDKVVQFQARPNSQGSEMNQLFVPGLLDYPSHDFVWIKSGSEQSGQTRKADAVDRELS